VTIDALILRVALLLSLAPSAVARMQATDVLALAVAETQRDREQRVRDVQAAALLNLAMWAPEKLRDVETQALERAGLSVPSAPSSLAFEAMLAAAPVVEAV
jgi:hypothetical protein